MSFMLQALVPFKWINTSQCGSDNKTWETPNEQRSKALTVEESQTAQLAHCNMLWLYEDFYTISHLI